MNNYRASKWQQEFHSCPADEMLGGGSAGPGKSLALLMDPCGQIAIEHARCQRGEVRWGASAGWALHLRKEMPRLAQTIQRSKALFKAMDAGSEYQENTHTHVFSSGYRYQFGHLKDADTYLNYRSQEYTWLGIDEIGEVHDKNSYDELVLRVRTADPVLAKMLKVRAVSNPWGNWVRDYFVEPWPTGRKLLTHQVRLLDGSIGERTRMFLPAKLSDNPDPAFRAQYELNLQTKPPHVRAMLLMGDWYAIAGAFFADCWDRARVVVKPFVIPSGWRRFRSGDWGYQNETAIHWWAVSPDNELICYRERTYNGSKAKQKLDAVSVAERIKDIEVEAGEWNRLRGCSRLTGPMDTNLWMEAGHRGLTMAHDMQRVGVNWFKASKGRRQCAQQVIKRLMQRGYNDRPGLLFFENCRKAIDTIPALPTDDSEEENGEVPKKCSYDHWYDSVSYACAANPLPSGKEDVAQGNDDDDGFPKSSRYDEPVKNRGSWGYG